MTARPWQLLAHQPRHPPTVVRTYATRERAQAVADRCNTIVAAQPDAKWLGKWTVRKRSEAERIEARG